MQAVAEALPQQRTLDVAQIPADKVLILPRPTAIGVIECLERACSYSGGRYDVPTTVQACAGQHETWKAQLWLAGYREPGKIPTVEAAAVTQRTVWPTGLVTIEVVMVGGRGAKEWVQLAPKMKEWAEREGAEFIQMIGRRGWGRTLPAEWEDVAHVYECALDGVKDDGGR